MDNNTANPFAKMFDSSALSDMTAKAQSMMQAGLDQSREALLKSIAAAQEGAQTLSRANPLASQETAGLTKRAFEQAIDMTEAAYKVAQSVSTAKTPAEIAQIQAEFIQAQFAKMGDYTRELIDLSTKVASKAMTNPPKA